MKKKQFQENCSRYYWFFDPLLNIHLSMIVVLWFVTHVNWLFSFPGESYVLFLVYIEWNYTSLSRVSLIAFIINSKIKNSFSKEQEWEKMILEEKKSDERWWHVKRRIFSEIFMLDSRKIRFKLLQTVSDRKLGWCFTKIT